MMSLLRTLSSHGSDCGHGQILLLLNTACEVGIALAGAGVEVVATNVSGAGEDVAPLIAAGMEETIAGGGTTAGGGATAGGGTTVGGGTTAGGDTATGVGGVST